MSANAEVAPDPTAEVLTFGETAFLLRVSVTLVRRLVDEGKIAFVAIKGRTLITREAIRRFLLLTEATKKPTLEAAAVLAADTARLKAQRAKIRVVADWNTGEDTFGIEIPPKLRSKKPAQP